MIEDTIPIGQSSLRNGLCWKSMESLCADKKRHGSFLIKHNISQSHKGPN